MVVGDIASLKPGEAKLSLIMNESGGIVDDTVITMGDDYVYMVVNGACKDKDITHFLKYMSDFEVTMHHLQSLQLIALQVRRPGNPLYIVKLLIASHTSCILLLLLRSHSHNLFTLISCT